MRTEKQAFPTYKSLKDDFFCDRIEGIWSEEDARSRATFRALNKLPPAELTIFLMWVQTGSYSKVARALKVNRSTSYRKVEKIRKKIKKEVNDELERVRATR